MPTVPCPGPERQVDANDPVHLLVPTVPRPGPEGQFDTNGPVHILIIDDVPAFLEVVVAEFNSVSGVTATGAVGGVNGLEQLKQQQYSVVLCDIQMPDLSGYEVTQQFRAWEAENRSTRQTILGHTGLEVGSQVMRNAAAAGMDSVLSKPTTFATVASFAGAPQALKGARV